MMKLTFFVLCVFTSCNSQNCNKANNKFYKQFFSRLVKYTDIPYSEFDSLSIKNLKCDSTNLLAIINRMAVLEEKGRDIEEVDLLNKIDFDNLKDVSDYNKNELRYRLILLNINQSDTLKIDSVFKKIRKVQENNPEYFSEKNIKYDTIPFLILDYALHHKQLHTYVVNANIITYLKGKEEGVKYLDSIQIHQFLSEKNIYITPYKGSNFAMRQEYVYNPERWLKEIFFID